MSRSWALALLVLAAVALPSAAPALRPALAAAPPTAEAGQQPPSRLEGEMSRLLQGAAGALARRDLGYLSSLLDPQAEVTVRGLGLDSHTVGRQRVRQVYGPELQAAQALSSVEVGRPVVEPLGPNRARVMARFVAYVSAEAMTGLALNAQPMPLPGQIAGLVELRGGHWYFQRLTVLLPGGQ